MTDRGREEAEDLAGRLDGVDRIVASDLRRCRETADRIADAHGVGVETDPAWRERDFGVYQGLTVEELDARVSAPVAETSANAIEECPESGEGMEAFVARVTDAWEGLIEGDADGTVVVTHGGPLYALLGGFEGRPMTRSVRDHDPDNCGVAAVHVDEGGAEVRRYP